MGGKSRNEGRSLKIINMENSKTQQAIMDLIQELDSDSLMIYLLEAGNRIGEIKNKSHPEDHQRLIFIHGEMMQLAALLRVA
jgi:hypothetical protein